MSHIPAWPRSVGRERELLDEVLSSSAWGSTAGHFVHDAEEAFATYHDAPHAVACTNGTVALISALSVLDLQPGSEVIVPAYTFIATAAAPVFLGLVPVYCDTMPGGYGMDPEALAGLIGPDTGAVIPVHLGGAPCDMDAILRVTSAAGVPVIEDAAQAAGVRYKGRSIPVGDMATFSFQSSKNITSGEGGMILTRDDDLAARLKSFVNVGRVPQGGWYQHDAFGMNLRLTEFQGAMLLEQLGAHPALQRVRQKNAEHLHALLAQEDGIEPAPVSLPDGSTHGQHLFLLRCPTLTAQQRDELVHRVNAAAPVGASTGYVPLHRNAALSDRVVTTCAALDRPVPRAYCPHSDALSEQTVWLPQTVLLADDPDAIDAIARVIVDAFHAVTRSAV